MASTTPHRAEDKAKFMVSLRERGTVSAACQEIGIDRTTAYYWRHKDEAFAAEWDAATERVTDLLEQTGIEMALNGTDSTHEILDSSGGVVVLKEHKADPGMVKFMLSARRRSIYGQRQEIELSGDVTVKRIQWDDAPSDDPPSVALGAGM